MQIPDFSKPSEDCFLTIDKNGKQLKIGDILSSTLIPFSGSSEPQKELYAKIEEYDGNLIIPHYGSFLLRYFVESHCEIIVN